MKTVRSWVLFVAAVLLLTAGAKSAYAVDAYYEYTGSYVGTSHCYPENSSATFNLRLSVESDYGSGSCYNFIPYPDPMNSCGHTANAFPNPNIVDYYPSPNYYGDRNSTYEGYWQTYNVEMTYTSVDTVDPGVDGSADCHATEYISQCGNTIPGFGPMNQTYSQDVISQTSVSPCKGASVLLMGTGLAEYHCGHASINAYFDTGNYFGTGCGIGVLLV